MTTTTQTARFSTRNPQAFGVLVTFLGVACFFPDALVIRLNGGDTMTFAVWRGLAAAATTFAGIFLFARHALPSWSELLSWPSLAMMLLQGLGSVLFLASMGQTSAANALLILATAPFLAALFAWFALRERIDRPTALAIAAVFLGVGIIAAGSWGGVHLLGDFYAFLNAACIALYYVVLRMVPQRNLLVSIALGYLLTSAIAFPFAPMEALDLRQSVLVFLSGGLILACGGALLMLGPRYLPAAEVSMITLLEIVIGPLLVWLVIGEAPGVYSLTGGAIILVAISCHSLFRLRQSRGSTVSGESGSPAI